MISEYQAQMFSKYSWEVEKEYLLDTVLRWWKPKSYFQGAYNLMEELICYCEACGGQGKIYL